MKILVTGASGVVGEPLCRALETDGHCVVRVVRQATSANEIAVGTIDGATDWSSILQTGVEAVVHLAAKTPSLHKDATATVEDFFKTNSLATENLARQCDKHGIKRFVFISTCKVLGDGQSRPYGIEDRPHPSDSYARSKWEAEQKLQELAAKSAMEIVILRPPIVYGPKVKGNFLHLLNIVKRQRPLPLGAIKNQRSLIFSGNLISAIQACLTHPAAAHKTYLVSDHESVSTPELIREIAKGLQCQPRLLYLPVTLMKIAGVVLGKKSAIERLTSSYVLDTMPIQEELSWQPPYSLQEGLKTTARWFLNHSFKK